MTTTHTTGGDSASKHNILTIPLEIFEAVAERAEPEDLLNLRLVNREAAQKVKRTFIATHFTERMFLLTYEESLLTLLAIAKHPEYGRAIQTLLFSSDESPGPEHSLAFGGDVDRLEQVEGHVMDGNIMSEWQDREWYRHAEEQKRFV